MVKLYKTILSLLKSNAARCVILVFTVIMSLSVHQALADLEVISSSDPNIAIGTTLPDNTSLNIPNDVTINILKTPENETYTLKGPFTGTLKEYTQKKKCGFIQRILGKCKLDRDSSETGGITGGVRGIKPLDNNKEK